MIRSLLLLAFFLPASAGERWLQVDDFESGDQVGVQQGFVEGECWAVIYKPEPDEYPFDLSTVRALVGGDSSQQIFDVSFYSLSGTDMNSKTLLGVEGAAVTGSNENFNDLTVADLELEMPQVESGNVAVAMCLTAHSGVPAIARDTDGTIEKSLNWIYADGIGWAKSADFGVSGDWIMRLCISGDNVADQGCSEEGDADTDVDSDTDTDSDSDTDSDLALLTITPAEGAEGESVNVVLLGTGFDDTAEARIGGLPLTGQVVLNGETITGRSSSALPAGVHDVEVVQDGESAYLPLAFEVTGGKCATAPGSAGLGLALVGLAALWRRRRA